MTTPTRIPASILVVIVAVVVAVILDGSRGLDPAEIIRLGRRPLASVPRESYGPTWPDDQVVVLNRDGRAVTRRWGDLRSTGGLAAMPAGSHPAPAGDLGERAPPAATPSEPRAEISRPRLDGVPDAQGPGRAQLGSRRDARSARFVRALARLHRLIEAFERAAGLLRRSMEPGPERPGGEAEIEGRRRDPPPN